MLDSSISDIIAKIHSFEPQIDGLKKALLKYKENVEKKVYANFLQAEALRFSKLIDNLQIKLKSKPNIPEYSRQATIDDDFVILLNPNCKHGMLLVMFLFSMKIKSSILI